MRTMLKRSRTDRKDLNQLAASIVVQAIDDEPKQPEQPEKNPAAVALGRLGGLKGGAARAQKLTAEERSEIAKKAAAVRWATKQSSIEEVQKPQGLRHVIRPEEDD